MTSHRIERLAEGAVVLAKTLDRPIGRGGGLRDPLPGKARDRFIRDRYVVVAVPRDIQVRVKREAEQRGLCVAAFLGMVIECALAQSADNLDEFLSGVIDSSLLKQDVASPDAENREAP